MTTQETIDLSELQQFKEQFGLIDEKLEKQRIINDEILHSSMERRLSHIGRWYRRRFRALFCIPIIFLALYPHYGYMGWRYWGFLWYMVGTAALEFYLYRRSYRALDIKNLPSMTMSQAAENIARHKHLVESGNRILLLPTIVLVAWTIFVSGGSENRFSIMAVTFVAMCIGIVFGLYQQRANRKRLDDVLEQIRKLRG